MKKIKINELEYDFSKYGSLFIEAPIGSSATLFTNQFIKNLIFIKNANIKIIDSEIFFPSFLTNDISNIENYREFNKFSSKDYNLLIKNIIKLFYQKSLKRTSIIENKNYKNVKNYNKKHNIKLNPEFLIINLHEISILDTDIANKIKFINNNSKKSNMFIIMIDSFDLIKEYKDLKTNSHIKLSNEFRSYGLFTNNEYKINKQQFKFDYLDDDELKKIINQKNKIK